MLVSHTLGPLSFNRFDSIHRVQEALAFSVKEKRACGQPSFSLLYLILFSLGEPSIPLDCRDLYTDRIMAITGRAEPHEPDTSQARIPSLREICRPPFFLQEGQR